jgi:hypothetical protein
MENEMKRTKRLIGIDDCIDSLENLKSDLHDCLKKVKTWGHVIFSLERKDDPNRGEEYHLFVEYEVEHKKQIDAFILGFTCAR